MAAIPAQKKNNPKSRSRGLLGWREELDEGVVAMLPVRSQVPPITTFIEARPLLSSRTLR
jgi:hypothetical protein